MTYRSVPDPAEPLPAKGAPSKPPRMVATNPAPPAAVFQTPYQRMVDDARAAVAAAIDRAGL